VVLKIAAEEGIDLSRVPGTGIGGRVSKRDLQRYLDSLRKGGTPAAVAQAQTNGVAPKQFASRDDSRRSHSSTGSIGSGVSSLRSISRSKADVAEPFTRRPQSNRRAHGVLEDAFAACRHCREVDVTNAMRLREKHKLSSRAAKDSISRSCRWRPRRRFAHSRKFSANELRRWSATPCHPARDQSRHRDGHHEGLLVPVIKAAQTMSVVGIARATRNSAAQSRREKITPDDLAAGSFTLSNPGRRGQSLRLRESSISRRSASCGWAR